MVLVSRKRRRYFIIRITLINVPINQNSFAPLAGSARLYSVILEIREDKDGEYFHLVTVWKATKAERELYEENS